MGNQPPLDPARHLTEPQALWHVLQHATMMQTWNRGHDKLCAACRNPIPIGHTYYTAWPNTIAALWLCHHCGLSMLYARGTLSDATAAQIPDLMAHETAHTPPTPETPQIMPSALALLARACRLLSKAAGPTKANLWAKSADAIDAAALGGLGTPDPGRPRT